MTTYVLAGGCFWCLDAIYRRCQGVKSVISGYTGGSVDHPSYQQVSSGITGHAEAVKITFDEDIIPARIILDLFFLVHNPTTLNQQGNDIGSQYRSAMFYQDSTQKRRFTAAVKRAQDHWTDPIVTELSERTTFYPAEDYHQDYFQKNPTNGYCSIVITPKIIKARRAYAKWLINS